MEPVEAAAEVLKWALVGGLILLAAVYFAKWTERGVRPERRTANRIPEREMELVGEDYRDHTADYFRKWSKRKAIINEVCRGD